MATGYILAKDAPAFKSMPALWPPPLTLESPILAVAAGAVVVASAVAAMIRRPAMPRGSLALILLGAMALAVAAGGIAWRGPRPGTIAVVVDVSASTRGASYRDLKHLAARIEQLLGRSKYTLYRMGDGVSPAASLDQLRGGGGGAPSRRTVFDAAACRGEDVILLFSDGQFAPPPSSTPTPPIYFVVDPELNDPDDAAVRRLEYRGGGVVAATVEAPPATPPRQLVLTNTAITATTTAPTTVPAGRTVITSRVRPGASDVTATLRGGTPDRWPENDWLALRLPPPPTPQRWWVGGSDPGAGWRHISASKLSIVSADYLAPGVIVLENLAAEELSGRQLECLEQYVRDLGGGIVIVGGAHAFAAGHYPGSTLERLSPLASTPPRPADHWIILADSSGSMAAALGDNSRWAFAVNAIAQLIPLLPPDDSLSVGSFADSLRWWRTGRPVREMQDGRFLPPRDISPSGPTNLGAALAQVAQTTDPAVPAQLLLITDAQAKIDDADALADKLRAVNVRVHLMCTEAIAAENPVRRIVQRSGGTIVSETNPHRWAAGLRTLTRGVAPVYLNASPLHVNFTDAGPALAAITAPPPWNRTWLKNGATELAIGRADQGQPVPAAAAWLSGSGAVIAVSFPADVSVASALADRAALPPRDPRFTVTWDTGQPLRARLDAADASAGPINGLSPQLHLIPGDPSNAGETYQSLPMRQTAPGRYEASLELPSRPAFASVRLDGRTTTIDRIAVAGRYPPEFDAIGNNLPAMRELARVSGGEVIDPSRTTTPIFHWPVRRVPLAPYCCVAGAILIAAGLVRWRRS